MHTAVVANGFAELYRLWGGDRFAGAEAYYKESIEILKREIGMEDVRYAQALQYLGQYYLDANRHDEALQQLQQNAAIKKSILGEHHAEYANVRLSAPFQQPRCASNVPQWCINCASMVPPTC